ncbi:MAG: hypothetical protein AB7P19_21695, partial [Nitrospira sp.]
MPRYIFGKSYPPCAFGPGCEASFRKELVLRPTISLDTPLGHTVPIIDGGVHGEIENRARPVFLAQEDG